MTEAPQTVYRSLLGGDPRIGWLGPGLALALALHAAVVAAAAPFVGLFGTVWGIMGAFRDIYQVGNANLATVARPISEALIATAVGLFAAVPALVAYNAFNSSIRVLENEMRNFSADFLNIIKRHIFKKAA